MKSKSKILAAFRSLKGMSLEELSKESGLSPSLLSRYESGRREVTEKRFIELMMAMSVSSGVVDLLLVNNSDEAKEQLASELGVLLFNILNERDSNEPPI